MEKDIIETFLDKRLITAPATRESYRINIQKYFQHINKDINTYFNKGYTADDYEKDLQTLYLHLEKMGKPALSTRTFFNAIKQLMISQNKDLRDLPFWEILKLRTRGAEPESDEAKMNAQDIRTILSHADTKARAMFLIMASSGRRISEILALNLDDVNLDTTPATINIKKGITRKRTKTGQKTLCFISNEARESLIAWLKERDAYIEKCCKKAPRQLNRQNKNPDDPRVFPMSIDNANHMWVNLLMKSGVVESEKFVSKSDGKTRNRVKRKHKGERVLMNPHSLRKFFRSYLGDADLSEYLMGHATFLTKTYRQMKHEDLGDKYLRCMPNVTIFENTPDLSGINESLKQKDDELKKIKAELMDKRLETLEMDKRIQALEKALEMKSKN